MRQMVSFTLADAGHEVTEADNGVKGLEAARARRYDLVITDVNMPGMNGLDLVKSLRQLPDFKFTPIFVLTTESAQDVKSKWREACATGWIVKPFSLEALLATPK